MEKEQSLAVSLAATAATLAETLVERDQYKSALEWKGRNLDLVVEYARSIVEGRKVACREKVQECDRFFRDLDNPAYEFDCRDPEFVIRFIETCVSHKEGESLKGEPLLGKTLLLEPWEKFIVYNLLGFRLKGTRERRFKEAFLFIARKNGKTPFAAALALAMAFLERRSGSRIYIVGAALKQARQAFDHILFNLGQMGELREFRVLDNNAEHSIERTFFDKGRVAGSLRIEALAANPDKQDSLVSNIQICDELHAYKSAKQYNVIKESGKAYSNRLCIGITTGGDNPTGFCYQRLQYCRRVLNRTCPDEQLFIFICKADEDSNGDVDYTSAAEHEKANPNYGVSIRPSEIMDDAIQAQNDPQQRKRTAAAIIGVPPFLVGVGKFDPDEFNAFIRIVVLPIARAIEQELTRKLLVSPNWYFRFNPRSLYAYSISELGEVNCNLVDRAIIDRNEARDALGYDPRDGLSELAVLENYIPYSKIGDQKKLEQSGKKGDKADG